MTISRSASWLLALAFVSFIAVGVVHHVLDQRETAWLVGEAGAEWIQPDLPVSARARSVEWHGVRFRRSFNLDAPKRAFISVCALREYRFFINGVLLDQRGAGQRPWRSSSRVDLSTHLRVGRNDLAIEVRNDRGPTALLVHSAELELVTDDTWYAESDHERIAVFPVAERRQPPISTAVQTPASALRSALPWLLVAFALGAAASFDRGRRLRSVQLRYALLVAWAALALNNAGRLPLLLGMDVRFHYEYIAHIANTGTLPPATAGWQTFQAPLFYLLAAPLWWLLKLGLSEQTALLALRSIPLLCAIGQLEIAYRTARLVFPDRVGAQMLVTGFAALLPLNLYISQVVGNEPLAGFLGSAVVYGCLALLLDSNGRALSRRAASLGALLGFAVLAKASALLLLLALTAALLVAARDRRLPAVATTCTLAIPVFAVIAISGWFFARTWLATGEPLFLNLGGWWQDPGYRVPAQLVSFGRALTQPVFSSVAGFWDGLYTTFWLDGLLSGWPGPELPPWNYRFVLAMALVALPMSGAGLVGALSAFRAPARERRAARFAVGCIALYGGALLYGFATIPSYSVTKSSYTLALLPCYALLVAFGMRRIPRGRLGSALIAGYIAAWAFCAYAGYWVV